MTIAVLDYNTGSIDIINDCPKLRTNEEVENYLSEVLEYNPDEIHYMFSQEIETNTLTPDDFSIDKDNAHRYDVIADIETKHREFMKKEGHAPLYVNCRIRYIDDEDHDVDVVIKMTTKKDEKDDDIFFYCHGLDDLVRLCYVDTEDFDVTEVYEFMDEIQ